REAQELATQHAKKIELQQLKVMATALKADRAKEGYRVYVVNQRHRLLLSVKPEEVEKQLEEDPERYRLETAYQTARREIEVEAEFAHRVTQDMLNRAVTITDHADGKLAYKGTVKRIGTAFLPKRSTADGFIQNDTRVLEAVVEVAEPMPAHLPPLRVGQKV